MYRLVILALAYGLFFLIDNEPVHVYYYYCSIFYSLIAVVCSFLFLKNDDLLILLYATVNYLTAVLHFLINFGDAYDYLYGFIWHHPLNLSLIINAIEFMLLLSGVGSAAVFIYSLFLDDCSKHKIGTDGMVRIK